jgi:hypothetical protein
MGIPVKSKVYELADEGVHSVVISNVKDLGLVETQFGTKDRVQITLNVLDQNDAEGNPINLFVTANKSLHAKSTLGNMLNQLGIGIPEPGVEFDVEDLVGVKSQVVVQHNKSSDGRTFANVTTFLKKK